MNKFKRTSGFLLVLLIVILSIPGMSENNNIIPQAVAASATLHVSSQDTSGNIKTGFYMILKQAGTTVATGFTPVDFTLNSGVQYTLTARGFGSYIFDHWLDTGSTVNPRTISIKTNTQLTAVYRIATISLNPTSGPAGTILTVTGKNFASNSAVTILYDNNTITTEPATVTTDSTGSFTGSITVPSSSGAGPHTVKATDASNHPASAQFSVMTTPVATISLNPTSGPTGTAVNISGSNFAANSGITISYDNNAIATNPVIITTDSTGSFTGSITVPSSIAGLHTVSAQDASANSASAQFTVTTPAITLNPTSGPTGTTVNISGNNFVANSGIAISYDNNAVTTTPTTVTSISTGSFTGSIIVPSSGAGPHTVNATDASSNSASASFTVKTPAITVSPSSGPTGTTINISGSNFVANSGITISYDNSAITTTPTAITTTSTGSFTGSITVPSSSGAGLHTVNAADASSNSASASFSVTTTPVATISLNPSSGLAGTTVAVTGKNFAPNSGITISYDGTGITASTSGSGTIQSDNKWSTSGTVSSSPYQITLPVNVGTGSNRVLIVVVEANNAGASTVTYNGGPSMTKAIAHFANNDAEIWYQTNPASGSHNIVVTMAGSTSIVVGAYSFFGVDQVNPIPTAFGTNNISVSNPAISITTKYANSWAINSAAIYGGSTLSGPTQTQQWNIRLANAITGASSSAIKSTPGLVTFSWTASPTDLWEEAAIEIKPAAPITVTTDSTGSFTGSITVPISSAAGPHTVKATDSSTN